MSFKEKMKATIKYRVEKYLAKDSKEIEEKGLEPYEVIESKPVDIERDVLLNEGISTLIDLICGLGTPTAWDNANARIGVGDGDEGAPTWAASTSYALGDKVKPTTPNDNVYECTVAGTSGTTEPVWPTTEGATVTDGTVEWTCRSGTPDAKQTDLIGVNKLYKGMNAGYPQKSAQNSIWQADFVDGEAEWKWEEQTIDNGSVAAVNLCRQNTDLGTKPPGQTWRLEGTITWS